MKKKIMAVALAAATVTSMVGAVGVSAATDVAQNDLAYKGELEIMHYSTSEESEGNGGSDGFRTVLAAWQEAHPDITLNENVLQTLSTRLRSLLLQQQITLGRILTSGYEHKSMG